MPNSNNENNGFLGNSNKRSRTFHVLRILLALVGAGLVCFFLIFKGNSPAKREENPALAPGSQQSTPSPSTASDLFYPTDILFTTLERDKYQDGEMQISIPRLEYAGPIFDGVSDAALAGGLGLYDQATTPGWADDGFVDNYNISIAGHRDLYGRELYYIDTITQGDQMVITYNGSRYTYTYLDTTIIAEDDWSVIYCTDQPILTLTSCDPIGIANKRIIVRATLTETEIIS